MAAKPILTVEVVKAAVEVQCTRAGLPGPMQKPAIIPMTQATLT